MSLRNERMTEEEARAVIALWQQRRVERGLLTTSPAVTDLAEGLDVSVEEARALLTEMRVRRPRKTRYADAPQAPRSVPGLPRSATRGVIERGASIALWLLIACAFGHAVAAAL